MFDAIVVGSGISGGWVAKELCERGLKVLMLERGPDVPHGPGYSHDEAATLRRRDDQIPDDEKALHYPYHVGVSYALFNSNKAFWASDHDHPYETVPGKPYRWIRFLNDQIMEFLESRDDLLFVTAPPRHGK